MSIVYWEPFNVRIIVRSVMSLQSLQAPLFITISIFLTYFGASRTLKGALGLSALANLSKSSTGAILVASVTALPELTSSLAAALLGSGHLALGNILGSNVYNLPLLLGLAGLIDEFEITNNIADQCAFLVLLNLVIGIVTLTLGTLPRIVGIGLLLSYLAFIFRSLGKSDECNDVECTRREAVSFTVFGGAALVLGSYLLVNNTLAIVNSSGLNLFFVGLVMSFGAVIPEVAVSLLSASRGEHEISVGNIVGDNIITATLVLGLVSLISPVTVSAGEVFSTIPFTILFTGLIYVMHKNQWHVTRRNALLFLLSAIAVLVIQIVLM
jgi:cation:H+ antiporter